MLSTTKLEIREGLEALLTSEGFDVTPAETGETGLQRLEDRPFDLMLLDVSLPDRNGLELLREIRRRDPQSLHHSHHGIRLDRHGSRRIQRRGAGLHHQAVVE